MLKNLNVTTANPSTMTRFDNAYAFNWMSRTVGAGCRFYRTDDELPSLESVTAWGKRRAAGPVKFCISPVTGRVLAIYWTRKQDWNDFEDTMYGMYDAVITVP